VITTAAGGDIPRESICFSDLISAQKPGFPAAAVGGDGPIIEIYTSGTTGVPKGVVWPLRGVAACQVYAEYALGVRDGDVFWNIADPGRAYGLIAGILAVFTTGVTGIFAEPAFSPGMALTVLSRYGVTNFTAAPTAYRAMRAFHIDSAASLNLRCASSAGEPLTPEIGEWAKSALGTAVHDHYGQTECGMLINNHHHPALRKPLKPGSMGQSMPGWAALILKQERDEPAAIGDVGRVAIDLMKSPLAWFQGYVDGPQKTAEKFTGDGRYYLTGDVGRMDEDGFFFFSSRDDDVILMSGYRIGPAEIESVLLTHPAVSECAVVAIPDELRGEVIVSAVVLRPGTPQSSALTLELQNWVKSRYAAHAYPRMIRYVDSLPKTPSGKIQRFIVRQHLRE
jgi:acetyl-CoA synthetase